MALRIKSQWHNEDAERSLDEIAGALAFNGWRIAMDKAIHLHGEQFLYSDDRQRLAVIAEYLVFIIQLVDRMSHEPLEDDDRRELITALALRLADHLQENSKDLLGDDDYRSPSSSASTSAVVNTPSWASPATAPATRSCATSVSRSSS